MTKTVEERIRAFIQMYLPDVKPPSEDIRVTPHGLMFDFDGNYPTVRFSTGELMSCLQDYLALIDPVLETVQRRNPGPPITARAWSLYKLGFHDATELLLAYIQRTRPDEHTSALWTYAAESDAVDQLERLLRVLDPDGSVGAMDSIKRIDSVQKAIRYWAEQREAGC